MRSLIISLLLLGSQAEAYLDYLPNADIAEEVQSHSYRVLPKGEHYAFAIDGDFFKPAVLSRSSYDSYVQDFYHGNGYWVAIRSEFKPVPDLILNLKTDFTHGTSSNGPTYQALIIPHFGFTYRHDLFGFSTVSRLGDINRQTIGIGIFIENKETEGGYTTFKKNTFVGTLMVDGTGSYRVDGGVIGFDLSIWNQLLGVTFLIQETDNDFSPPQNTGSIYSKKTWRNGFGYGAETAVNQAAFANLAYLQYENQFERLSLLVKPQFRHYGKGILGSLGGRVHQNYVSYDQNDKPFTSLMDIFPYGDNVETYTGLVKLEYAFSSFYHYYVENEAIRLQYRERRSIQSDYFRTGFKFFPSKDRADEFGILVGNKYLNASTTTSQGSSFRTYSSPVVPDLENKPLFFQQVFVMFTFVAKF